MRDSKFIFYLFIGNALLLIYIPFHYFFNQNFVGGNINTSLFYALYVCQLSNFIFINWLGAYNVRIGNKESSASFMKSTEIKNKLLNEKIRKVVYETLKYDDNRKTLNNSKSLSTEILICDAMIKMLEENLKKTLLEEKFE